MPYGRSNRELNDAVRRIEERMDEINAHHERLMKVFNENFKDIREKFLEPEITRRIDQGFADRIDSPGLRLTMLLTDAMRSIQKESE